MQRVRVDVEEGLGFRLRHLFEERGFLHRLLHREGRRQLAGLDRRGGLGLQLVVEDGAEDRRPERAADRAEERHTGGRGAQVLVADVVLHRDHQHLHDQAQAEAEHQHRERVVGGGGRVGHPRQHPAAQGHHGGADDREDLVAAGPGDQLPGADRGDQQAEHQREEFEP